MANDWILDVLADLSQFAARNDLAALAVQLEQTAAVAAREIASNELRAAALIGVNAAQTRMVHRSIGRGDDA
ncbi:hypothetical protein [Oceaniglobus trochenteri]|uniref:hypothetical protein n=1 Tax=Oceaniglobus trochenteri TaxID=2763260 RepID=UPI001CFFC614|nr:hypothetical protein [Oceaniglobus trochenteri]